VAFAYREVTISGLNKDVEGTAKAIQEITDVMVNEMGWVLFQDLTASGAPPGHRMILQSDTGESGTDSSWYLIMTSGTSNEVGIQISSAWDTGAQAVPGSGVVTPTAATTVTLETDEDGHFVLWVSGDKDAVNFITRIQQGTYGNIYFGKALPFLDDTFEPFGVYLVGSTSNTIVVESTSAVRALHANPVEAITAASQAETLTYNFGTTETPYNQADNEPIFSALPLIFTVDAPTASGAIGVVRNTWITTLMSIGFSSESILTVSEGSETYQAFSSSSNNRSLIIRRS